jgi:hypothetical protein
MTTTGTKADLMWNVHMWDGKEWVYLFTAKAENAEKACLMGASRNGTWKKYQAWPHIDNFEAVA